ncbi:MAG TPA: SMC family ATPase [Campylobacterales bacterium]|nr:SMC family ATPase [Campylobacterales bacterium]
MILSSLNLENFKRYKSKTIEFGQGLIGIIGKNGTGKSTIFEAILFALYGELRGRGWKETIRYANATTKDVVSCELIFEFEGCEYRVVREFRGKTLSANAKLYKNEELQVSGAREVTNSIISLTKMSKDAFIHTLFASQKELTSLSSLKNEDRKKMIRKLLGLQKIDFIEKLLLEKSTDLRRDIKASAEYLLSDEDIKVFSEKKSVFNEQKSELEKELLLKEKNLNELSIKELELKKELLSIQATKDKKLKFSSELEVIKNSIDSSIKQQKKLDDELRVLEKKKSELKSLEATKKEYLSLRDLLKEQDKFKEYHLKKEGLQKEQVQLRVQWTKYKADIALLEKECSSHDRLIQEQKTKIDEINSLKQTIKKELEVKTSLLSQIGGEQKLIDDTNKKISKIEALGKTSNCPTCTRPLLEEYDNVINSLNKILQETQEKKIKILLGSLKISEQIVKDKELKIEILNKSYQTILQNINLIQSKQKDLVVVKEHFRQVVGQGSINKQELEKLDIYTYDEPKHLKMITQERELKSKYEYILELETILKRYDLVELELKNISESIKAYRLKYDEKNIEFKQIEYDEQTHKSKQKLYDEISNQKDEKTKIVGDIKVKIASISGELKSIQNSLKQNEKKLEKVQTKKDDLVDYDKIKVALSEFKTKINSKIAPRISSIASDMYATITKGKYQHIEVSNDFDFYIYDDGKKYPIERFSGGEIDLANLVLRIAISKTLAELNGASSIGFLAFDEVFGSQDEARRIEILEAFHTIKEQYRQIFLISHEMEIKEMFESVVEL